MVKYNTAKLQSDGSSTTIKEITYAPSVWIDFAQKILFWPDRENFACEQWLRYKDPAVTWRTFSIDKMYGPTSRDNVHNLMNQVKQQPKKKRVRQCQQQRQAWGGFLIMNIKNG